MGLPEVKLHDQVCIQRCHNPPLFSAENGQAFSLALLKAGPFISGTTHTVLRLGQRLNASTSEIQTEQPKQLPQGRLSQSRKVKGNVTLKDLVDNKLIIPGRNKVSVVYKGTTTTASLQADGQISFQSKQFNNPSAFSIHCKRTQTPNKRGDDGWKSVLYEGVQLDVFRSKLQAFGNKQSSTEQLEDAEEREEEEQEATEDRGMEAETGTANDQWVQCDRCRTWRVVPPEDWPEVEADEREEWLCEYAAWNVEGQPPFKPACGT